MASLSWSLPPRTHDRGDGVVAEAVDTSRTGVVSLNGCRSSSGDGKPITSFSWTVTQGGAPIQVLGAGCSVLVQRTLTSSWQTYTVTLKVTSSTGKTASTTQPVRFRDILIASLGDSAASGEGNPDTFGYYDPVFTANNHAPQWADWSCDRSGRAATAQLALRLQRSNPDTSVTFWHLACSGASISNENPGIGAKGGLITDFQGGTHSVGDVPAQVPQLGRYARAAGRPVDSLLLTIGSNDIGFAPLLRDCYSLNLLHPGACENKWAPIIAGAFNQVPGLFGQLHSALGGLQLDDGTPVVSDDRVFLTQYFDPTHDGSGWPFNGFSPICVQDPVAPNAGDRAWGYHNVVQPLNNIVRTAAGTQHWHYVDGIEAAFNAHGYCAADSWIRGMYTDLRIEDSLTVFDALAHPELVKGSWHPNTAGQSVIADYLAAAVRPVLGVN